MSLDTEPSTTMLVEDQNSLNRAAEVEADSRKRLESTALRAMFWTVMDYGASTALRVVNSMILTRLLLPESFGLMTLVATLIAGIGLISDIGLTPSVVQSPYGDQPNFLNTAWTLQVIRGAGIFVVSLLLAWPASLLYHEPRLLTLLPGLGITVILGGFYSTNLLSMSRHMGVRRVFLLDVTGQIFSIVVTVCLALLLKSVWALMLGAILTTTYKLILGHQRWMIPGIKNHFCWDRESLHHLVHFGKWILLGTGIYFFASQADRLIMGKLISFSLLGVYGIAYAVSDIPRAIISSLTNKVMFPFIAKMSHLPAEEFRATFLQYRRRILLAGAFLLSVMVYFGGFLVTRMYDARYHDASWMVPVLSLGLWHTLMYSTTQPALFTLGKSQYGAVGNAFYFVIVVSAIPLGFHFYGLFGAVVAVAVGDLPMYVTYVIAASHEKISTWRQDLIATTTFIGLLAVGYAIRLAF